MAKTAFLPDKEREAEEKRVMEELKAKWVKEQEEIQTQTMEFEFLVWDGVGVRKTVTCKKGDTIGDFLGFVKHKCEKFKGIPTDSLMFVKEDLIIPNVLLSPFLLAPISH